MSHALANQEPTAAPQDVRTERLVEDAIVSLRKALDTRPSRRVVLVSDPTLGDPIAPLVTELGLPSLPVSAPRALKLPAVPYLVEVDDEAREERLVNASLRMAVDQALGPAPGNDRRRSMCAWLPTSEPLSAIAEELGRRMRIVDERGDSRAFRFWDPRVTQHMAALFPAQPPSSWLTKSEWGYIDAFGRWKLLPAMPEAHQAPPAWPVLQQLSRMNAVQQQLAIKGLAHPPEVMSQIDASLGAGIRAGLVEEVDLISFAAHRVRLQVGIERSPLIRDAMEEAVSTGGHYYKVVETFTGADWAAVKASVGETTSTGQGWVA